MEIICCRKCIVKERKNEPSVEVLLLADWACDCYKYRRLDWIVANYEEAKADVKFSHILNLIISNTNSNPQILKIQLNQYAQIKYYNNI